MYKKWPNMLVETIFLLNLSFISLKSYKNIYLLFITVGIVL